MTLRISLFLAALVVFAFPSAGNAALVTYTDPVAYLNHVVALSLTNTGFTNFDSLVEGPVGNSFIAGGIQFTSPSSMRIASGTTSSPSFFLGFNDVIPEFATGDQFTITLPANSRAVSLQIITKTVPDALAFASLTVGGASVDMVPGGLPLVDGFSSYFVGIVSSAADIGSAVVEFKGTGFGLYRADDVGAVGLTAVPEPSSLVLVAVVCMSSFTRRRNLRSARI